jgi:hypothetical protein
MVYAPVGGFGNHIRWLALLDKGYTLNFNDQLLTSVTEKIEFIKNFVYCSDRTYHNWLKFEFKYRLELNSHLLFTHDMTNMFDECKMLAIKCDPDVVHHAYVKFNPGLNGINKETFLKMVNKQNKMCIFAEQYLDTVKCIDSTNLFQPTLDNTIYNDISTVFNLDNYYSEAQEIHTLWYNLHLKAESEYVQSQLTI